MIPLLVRRWLNPTLGKVLLAAAIAVIGLLGGARQATADPNQGPGGPILVVTSSTSTFGKYYAEILRTEGLNEFAVADISNVSAAVLASYDVVILGKMTLSASQVSTLTDWVNGGGNLIAMGPDPQLASLLGVSIAGGSVANGYIQVNTLTRPGNGIAADTMQFHGTAAQLSLSGATRLATLYSSATVSTPHSAVTLRDVGLNGGQVAAFAYDLATSIVYTRQGNPAWVGQERDGFAPLRSSDLFYGPAAQDPQPNWIDLAKVAIPQADEQQRFLANLITHMGLDRKPLPRFWYLPHGHSAAVVLTGDEHGTAGWTGSFDQLAALSPAGCSIADWNCYRGTTYTYSTAPVTNTQAAAYVADGFEVAAHISTGCGDYTSQSLDQTVAAELGQFAAAFPSVPAPETNRIHCIAWSGWTIAAQVGLNYGIRFDANYYYWPPGWVNDTPGHFTGSAMPMRFADLDGTLIDVFQGATQVTDESGQSQPFTIETLLDRAIGPEEQYGVYTVNAHTDPTGHEAGVREAVIGAAIARDVPIVSAKQMLDWLDSRNASAFSGLAWDGSQLSFALTVSASAHGLRALVPLRTNTKVLETVRRGVSDVEYHVVSIKGVDYASISAQAGSYTANYVSDSTGPTIVARFPAPGAINVAPDVLVTATFSESIDPTTVNAATVELRTSSGTLVPATISYLPNTYTAVMDPSSSLTQGTTYTATIRGGATAPQIKDMLGNALTATSSWSFTVGSPGPSCPCSIWGASSAPAVAAANDTAALEVGVKFRTSVSGFITGVRFYKGIGNGGTHIGSLWSSTGAQLATATFTNESASGWQTVTFGTPVPINADTVYVASYFAPQGRYAINEAFFASSGLTNGPLYLLRDGESGGNGVYRYGSSSGFPTSSFNSSNYWVDVIFTVTLGPDTTPPTMTTTVPAGGATGVALGTMVSASFSEPLDPATANTNTFELRDASNGIVAATVAYNGSNNSVTLTPTSSLAPGATYTATARGGATDPRIKDAAGNALAADATWSFTTTVPVVDTTPPTVTARTPANGATGVAAATTVTATFSEPLDASTVNTATFELRNASNQLVSANVTYNAASDVATLTPATALAAAATYTATLRGGATDPRIKDVAGNALAANSSWSFTVQAAGACPCSVWTPTTVPGTTASTDTGAVELGVKFRASSNGFISGVKFYKGAGNAGTHVGNLWNTAGTRLATATFTNETASGWQTVTFPTPVAVAANTVYVASYHAPVGHYAINANYFTSAGITNGPLYALRNGESGGNGVYRYGGTSGYPDSTWNSSNYWVDVVFETSTAPDTTPPAINARSPIANATGVAVGSSVTATFSEPLDAATVNATTFELRNSSGVLVPASVGYDGPTNTATLAPTSVLTGSTTYTATLRGGATDPRIKDLAGNALAAASTWSFTTAAAPTCTGNPIVVENCLTGNPASEWDVDGVGDPSIQGFATNISVNRGSPISFKVDTNASAYRFDIYRLGYYGGMGARKIATVLPSASLPQNQPNCLNDGSTGLIDCGNWAVSGSWTVPANATSGVYIARLVRSDNGGASHIAFIVRNDSSTSDLFFQTSDTTWQAYNEYGGNSVYVGSPAGRAYKVSYNRPFTTREVANGQDWLFNAEYPTIRWLEANGYDVSYTTGIDSDRNGTLIQNHRVFLSVGHDEYWSAGQRTNVEAARDAGVHLAFFSGNEVFWKTRWENSIDGSGTSHRTLVTYKETHANSKIDPTAAWTGTWRDPRFSPPADGNRPENALTGTLFMVNDGATTEIEVPEADGKMRLWRNTSIATLGTGTVATLANDTLGYEWDIDADNAVRPAGLIRLSTTTRTNNAVLLDHGSNFGAGTVTHALTLYKAPSGALVFGAGTVQWVWGLDAVHDRAGTPIDVRMRQATVNLLADMNVQPSTLQAGLVAATASTDTVAPNAVITSPAAGASLPLNSAVVISGTATDSGGGRVGGIEVSVDGGTTWRRANGRASWSYNWTTPATAGSRTIRVRAADDSANLQTPGAGVTVNVGTPDVTNPVISITSPTTGTTFSSSTTPINIGGTASDNTAVTQVTWTNNQGGSGTATGTTSWTVTAIALATGPNVLTVTARDAAGNTSTDQLTVTYTPPAPDTTNPVVTITTPTSNPTHPTSVNPMTLGGTSSDNVGVTQVTWSNDRGGSGVATGTTSWNITGLVLFSGQNILTVTARDAAGNTSSDQLIVTFTPPADTINPAIAITTPTSATTHSTGTTPMSLGGTASDNVGVTQVTWVNSRGGSGTATGTTNWNVTGIVLQSGANALTVTARDSAGNTSTDQLTVTYTPAVAGLVAAYAFNENGGGTVADASGTGNQGTISGATWTTQGRYGNALQFDGTNDRVDVLDSNSLDLTNGLTVEAWVFPTTLSAWRTVLMKETSNGLSYGLYAHDNAPRPAGYVLIGGGDREVLGNAALPLNTWTHMAITYDGTTLRYFQNGTQITSRAQTGNITTSASPLRIGGNAPWGEYFSGRIDEVRVYNRALSAAEIQTDMSTAVGGVP